MYQIHGMSISSNTTKILYVAEELGIDYEFVNMDMSKGEHKSPEHMARHPLGKVPTLTHDEKTLFESGTICRYLASVEHSDLYPISDHYLRCQIDQWMDLFSNHVGRWLNTYAFEKVAKAKFGFGEPNKEVEDEAREFLNQQLPAVDNHLGNSPFITGNDLTIADPFAFAYMEMAEMAELAIDDYANLNKWYSAYKNRDSVARAKNKAGAA